MKTRRAFFGIAAVTASAAAFPAYAVAPRRPLAVFNGFKSTRGITAAEYNARQRRLLEILPKH